MLDFKLLFKNEIYTQLLKKQCELKTLLLIKEKFDTRLTLIKKINKLKQVKNTFNVDYKISNNDKKNINFDNIFKIKEETKEFTKELYLLDNELFNLTSHIPNIPALDTPENENRIVDEVVYNHDIKHLFVHSEILIKLKMIIPNGSNVLSGNKFVVYQNSGSKLLRVLINFLLNFNERNGYIIYDLPYLVYRNNLYNTGQLPKFEEDLYHLQDEDYYLIPTAEVTLINLWQNKIFKPSELPVKATTYSPCFRLEAGSAGQEDKGLVRLHQFNKVEIIQLTHPNKSESTLLKMLENVCSILKELRITYRVVELCYKELGFSSYKTFDVEIWLPNSKKWLEISSCSNCTDFQARRANIKLIDENKIKYFIHSLNASSLAIDRLIVALCEYYYDEKQNCLKLPDCLNKFIF